MKKKEIWLLVIVFIFSFLAFIFAYISAMSGKTEQSLALSAVGFVGFYILNNQKGE